MSVNTASAIPAASRQTFALGSQVTPSGAVADEATGETFTRGGEVFLSVNVTGASTDQQVQVEWFDATGRVVASQQRLVPEGARYVTFSSRPSNEGAHKAVVVINGRRVTELPFDVL